MELNELLKLAIKAALAGGNEIMKVYDQPDFETAIKEDRSPLTRADLEASRVITSTLSITSFPMINEEIKNKEYTDRKNWNQYWIIDPLDGTKEFIKKNGEFTINIAFCNEGSPIFGVIYVPVSRELYYGTVAQGAAYKKILDNNHEVKGEFFNEKDRIFPSEISDDALRIVGSRSHMNQETLEYMEAMKGKYNHVELVSKGSSLKFCLVAEGKADVYPRYAPTMEWDTAAGHAICNAVGLTVTSRETNKPLKYNKVNLLNPYFIVHRK